MSIRFVLATIAVAGASKGSVIASLISIPLQLRDIRRGLMADCNGVPAHTFRPRGKGAVPSICEALERVPPTVAWAAL